MVTGQERVRTVTDLITCDDEILSGIPVFKSTRVPIKNLIDLEAGDSLDEFLDDFPAVSRQQAKQLLEMEKEVLLAQVYADSHRRMSAEKAETRIS